MPTFDIMSDGPDEEIAEAMVDLLEGLIDYLFVVPSRVDAVRSALRPADDATVPNNRAVRADKN